MNRILVSTGTMVAPENGFDYVRALGEIKSLYSEGLCDGLELMMLKFYYDKRDAVVSAVKDFGVKAETIHCEKDIGTMLSDAGGIYATGDRETADEISSSAFDLFRYNCTYAEKLGIDRMVLHLWGGFNSDSHIEYNIEKFEVLKEVAGEYGVKILIENIPSRIFNPRRNWQKLLPSMDNAGFVFDTRFGMLHRQIEGILLDSALMEKVEHVHISDFAGTYRQFRALRPILHPGEGSVDFKKTASLLRGAGYDGTITLESPVAYGESLDVDKLADTLKYLKDLFCKEN
ncbi:MAG: sugar phosphate isomerase/epimerase [Ruminococcaceae bacterium]|nr:sugar phosphate isomerase/epimerase [Oscillospiraceae bacterium]